MRAIELLAAFATAPGGVRAHHLRLRAGLAAAPAGRPEPPRGHTSGRLRCRAGSNPRRPSPRVIPCRRATVTTPASLTPDEAPSLAVRLQLKLGAVTEQDQLADSPDTDRRGRAVGRLRRPDEGQPLPARHVAGGGQPGARGDPDGRRHDPQRVLLRRVGRHPAVPDQGPRRRQQAARPPAGPLRHRATRPTTRDRSASRWPSSADASCTSRPSGPAEAYLIRQARLSTLPDPNRDRGLPVPRASSPRSGAASSSSATRCASCRRTSSRKIGTDALKDALVTLHPQSAIEHLHARFVAADGKGSDGALAFEATEVGATYKSKSLVPVRPAEPLAGAPDRRPDPAGRHRDGRSGRASAPARPGRRTPRATGSSGPIWRLQDLLPRRRPAPSAR